MKDLEYLTTYWKKVNDISAKITKELPEIGLKEGVATIGKNITLVNSSSLGGKWGWSMKRLTCGRSDDLEVLAAKIKHMIFKGDAPNIQPMLESISKGVIKKLGAGRLDGSVGRGHFRWNNRKYTLDDEEINRVKDYFSLE